jgi:hypothetical protein
VVTDALSKKINRPCSIMTPLLFLMGLYSCSNLIVSHIIAMPVIATNEDTIVMEAHAIPEILN